jgi:hypothetical protein
MSSRFAGPLFFAVVAFLLFSGAYAMWPAGFFSALSSGPTIDLLIRAASSLVLAAIGVEFLGALVIAVVSDS